MELLYRQTLLVAGCTNPATEKMMTTAELKAIGVMPWAELEADFEGSDILLGNGFSIAIHSGFRYDTLFVEFLDSLGPHASTIFQRFGTSDFEAILADLTAAARVNDILGLPTTRVARTAHILREGLIRAVESVHPRKSALDWSMLNEYAAVFDQFGDIFTTNYDALLYHIIMLRKDRYENQRLGHPYNDFFWDRISSQFLRFRNFQNYPQYRHAYYLHGALFLFTTGLVDRKIRRTEAELLDEISSRIREGELPLFISEGRSDDKRLAIARSEYLRFAHGHFHRNREKLVVFGCALAGQDKHIRDGVRASRHIAISIYPENQTIGAIQQAMQRFRNMLTGRHITFFDSRTLFG